MADEGGMQNSHVAKSLEDLNVVSRKAILPKLVEVGLAILIIGLIVDPFDSFHQIFPHNPKPKLDDIVIIYVTVAGYLIINSVLILGHMMGDRMPKRTLVLFSTVGTILHIVAGIMTVYNWRKLHGNSPYVYNFHIYPSKQYEDMLISAAVFAFINALVFGLDVFLTIRYF